MKRSINKPARRVAAAVVLAVAVVPGAVHAKSTIKLDKKSDDPITFALLGDLPYGEQQTRDWPIVIDDVNAADDVDFTVHVGDIKRAASSCSDEALEQLASQFSLFDDPVVYTPGDNEWTDCHVADAGSYLPTERLDALRSIFFPEAGRTLGRTQFTVDSQADGKDEEHRDFIENVMFRHHQVQFATIHVVGSNNNLAPWTGLAGGDLPDQRVSEFEARNNAALAWLTETFNQANKKKTAGVFIAIHADAVDANGPGFDSFLSLLVDLAADYGKPVMLAHGDFHELKVDNPFPDAPNITRVETFGVDIENWIAVTVDPETPTVFSLDFRSTQSSLVSS